MREIEASGLARHEAWALAEAATGRSREFLIAHADEGLGPAALALFHRLAALRSQGVPLAYLVGWREFYGRPFWVNRHTLIPRPETELLVDTVLAVLGQKPGPIRLCDLGTGSGCIAITLALEIATAELTAIDTSEEALQVARNNAAWLGVAERIRFRQGSWTAALNTPRAGAGAEAGQKFHGLVSNPPYVAAGDPHLGQGDLRFEPASALTPQGADSTAAADGLGAIAGITRSALQWLEPRGFLLVEHGFDQQQAVIGLMTEAGLTAVRGLSDLQGQPRAVIGFAAV